MLPVHYHDLKFADVFVFETFIISQIREGVVLQPENNEELKNIINTHFTDKKLVYIANRAHAYNVSPLTYMETSKIDNLIGMCIVTDGNLSQQTANFESKFYTKAFKVSNDLMEAMVCADNLVKEAESQH
jgi:hypothetical protein